MFIRPYFTMKIGEFFRSVSHKKSSVRNEGLSFATNTGVSLIIYV
jgi:hypothetical protein